MCAKKIAVEPTSKIKVLHKQKSETLEYNLSTRINCVKSNSNIIQKQQKTFQDLHWMQSRERESSSSNNIERKKTPDDFLHLFQFFVGPNFIRTLFTIHSIHWCKRNSFEENDLISMHFATAIATTESTASVV